MMSNSKKVTPLKFNIATEKWWLEDDPFLLGPGNFFRGEILELQVGNQLLTPQVLKLSDFQTQEKTFRTCIFIWATFSFNNSYTSQFENPNGGWRIRQISQKKSYTWTFFCQQFFGQHFPDPSPTIWATKKTRGPLLSMSHPGWLIGIPK